LEYIQQLGFEDNIEELAPARNVEGSEWSVSVSGQSQSDESEDSSEDDGIFGKSFL
jgi:hypothetical protein